MKSFAAIVSLLLFVTVMDCAADLSTKLIGTWTGKLAVTYKGETTQSSATSVIKPFEQHGFIFSSTVKTPGQPLGKSVMRAYDSGRVEGAVSQGGQTLSVLSGTWSVRDNTLTIKTNVSAVFGFYRQTSKFVLTSRRKMNTVASSSFGARAAGTMIKK